MHPPGRGGDLPAGEGEEGEGDGGAGEGGQFVPIGEILRLADEFCVDLDPGLLAEVADELATD